MSRYNENTFDIDNESDLLKIELKIYNTKTYDILNKRDVFIKAVLEIKLTNLDNKPVEIFSPRLSIEKQDQTSIYCSNDLSNLYPKIIESGGEDILPFDSINFYHLLNKQREEIVRILVFDTNGECYDSIMINGDSLENILIEQNKIAVYQAKHIFKFDQLISQNDNFSRI